MKSNSRTYETKMDWKSGTLNSKFEKDNKEIDEQSHFIYLLTFHVHRRSNKYTNTLILEVVRLETYSYLYNY